MNMQHDYRLELTKKTDENEEIVDELCKPKTSFQATNKKIGQNWFE